MTAEIIDSGGWERPALTGIDVSYHQSPYRVNWAEAGAFGIVRASIGAKPDTEFIAHCSGARSDDVPLGGYHFLYQNIPAAEQFRVFISQLDAAGFGPGDILPIVDIEPQDKHTPIVRSMMEPVAREFCRLVWLRYGGCMVYGSGFLHLELGDWLLAHPRWVSDYAGMPDGMTRHERPADGPRTYGVRAVMWQFAGNNGRGPAYPGPIDLNVARWLPLITEQTQVQRDLSYSLRSKTRLTPDGYRPRLAQA